MRRALRNIKLDLKNACLCAGTPPYCANCKRVMHPQLRSRLWPIISDFPIGSEVADPVCVEVYPVGSKHGE
jgi:hypothetical protein